MPEIDLKSLKRHPSVLRLYQSRVKLQKENQEYVGLCPIHSEKSGSFRVFQNEGAWVFKCFGCGATGSIIDLVAQQDKIGIKEAIRKVNEYVNGKETSWSAGKDSVEKNFKPFAEETKTYTTLPLAGFAKCEQALADSPQALAWIKSRGIDYETAKKLHWGFRQSLGSLAGEKNRDIADAGWMVFPCVSGDKILSIKYRSIARKVFTKQPGMATVLYNTEAISPMEPIFVCEGEIDCGTLEGSGFRTISLQSSSTRPSPEMKDEMLLADQVILAGDTDVSGAEAMSKLWSELQDRTFLLKWPAGMKDANQTLTEYCKGDREKFHRVVEELLHSARSTPMPNVFSLQETMSSSTRTNLVEHPNRLRFPWRSVDKMVVLVPGGIMTVMATSTKQGKTAWTSQLTMHAARFHNEVVLNYQCELSPEELATIVAAQVLKKDRNHLTVVDNQEAARRLMGVKYYVGRDPTLNTVGPVLDLIEAAIRRLGITLVVLDHLHFICRNEQNEVQAQANAMQRIKNLAVKYGVKFIVVGQPRKPMQQNKGKVVGIQDWKGSETGGSDSDAIFAIHRDTIKVRDETTKDDYDPRTEVHLLGCRSRGDGGTFAELMFMGKIATFEEMSKEEPPPAFTREKNLV